MVGPLYSRDFEVSRGTTGSSYAISSLTPTFNVDRDFFVETMVLVLVTRSSTLETSGSFFVFRLNLIHSFLVQPLDRYEFRPWLLRLAIWPFSLCGDLETEFGLKTFPRNLTVAHLCQYQKLGKVN